MKNIMDLISKISVTLLTSCIMHSSVAANAANENHTLHVYITNETSDTLKFERVEGSNPGNHFSVSPQVLNSGEHGIITAEKLMNNDVVGRLVFTNSAGVTANLIILDQEQIHFGQPIFDVSGTKHHSLLVSQTRNKNVGPRYLTIVEADLRVLDKS